MVDPRRSGGQLFFQLPSKVPSCNPILCSSVIQGKEEGRETTALGNKPDFRGEN